MCSEKELLPDSLTSSLLCSVILPHVDNIQPNIVSCHSNGFLYEVKNKKVIGYLNIKENRINSISVFYLNKNDVLLRYYLIFTPNNKFFIVKKTENFFQITKTFNNVQKFKIYDFQKHGFPQIQLFFKENSEFQITDIDICNLEHSLINPPTVKNNLNSTKGLAKLLEEKLKVKNDEQIIHRHVDELNDSSIQIKKNILNNNRLTNQYSLILPISPVKIEGNLKGKIKSDINVIRTWYRAFNKLWVLGARILNTGKEVVHDLEVFINHRKLNRFTYSFFLLPDVSKLSWPIKVDSTIKPGQELVIIAAFEGPVMILEKEILIDCFLISSYFDINLKIDTICISASGMIRKQKREFTVDDIMIIRATQTETKLIVKTEYLIENKMEEMSEYVFVGILGFQKIKLEKVNFYYCTTKETGIILEVISSSPLVWQLFLYTSENYEIYNFTNALYDILPENTEITNS